ncbi:signal peptidase I [Altererythrobacter salegens]|uniref:Signal peptidase I n=2 Tax=Croceibacterium salegens TaxID=1737568 RepID=A0A6I4SW87_9SPHN|nr:signal peptidase I [Croceibacterium salegens]
MGTRFGSWSVRPSELARGDIVIVKTANGDYVSRIAALPGDRIAMVKSVVVLNGKPMHQQRKGSWRYKDEGDEVTGSVLLERFPGEKSPHRILDSADSMQDQLAETVLPRNRYFLLSDNRDHAADSRYPPDMFGIGMVDGGSITHRIDLD